MFLMYSGCVSSLSHSGDPAAGTYKRKLPVRVMGARRSYLVHVPQGYRSLDALPLVVVIHGAFSTAKEMEKQTGFSRLADREHFITVYPNGAYGIMGFLQHWNAGHCCGKAASENIDDVGFIDRVIDDAGEILSVDRLRVYIAGFSNGGMLAYRYASERPARVAAAAAVGASAGGRASPEDPLWITPEPAQPVPMIILHGRNDTHVPYEGGTSPRKGGPREYLSVQESAEIWSGYNNCRKDPVTEKLSGEMIKKYSWSCSDGEDSALLQLLEIEGWEHKWPGRYFTGRLADDHPLKGFDASEVIWEFFKARRR
jgi:polyhydroxybutyrate depolymerase